MLPGFHWWLTSCSPQETRESRMRQECWASLGAWNSWVWTHCWIIDFETGYILPSMEAGRLWGSRILFSKGESRAFPPFSYPLCPTDVSEGDLLGVIPYSVLCFLGIVYSERLPRWSSLYSPAPATTCRRVDFSGKTPLRGGFIQGGTMHYWKAVLQSG